MTEPSRLPHDPGRGDAHVRFKEAVLALSDEPTPTNLLRYLQASRALEAAQSRISSKNAA